MLNFFQPQNLH